MQEYIPQKGWAEIEGSLSVRWLTFHITRDSEYKQELKSVAERHKFGVKTYGWNLIMRQNYMEKNVTQFTWELMKFSLE